MTFIEFKKALLDAEISLPKFCKLIKISDKNLQSYKKKGNVPNTIAVIVTCFARLHKEGTDYRDLVESLQLKKQTKTGGFKKKSANPENLPKMAASSSADRHHTAKDQKRKKRNERPDP